MHDNCWGEYFGAQLIPCFIGLTSHQFVEEECGFRHNFLYAKPGVIEGLKSLSPENIRINILTKLQEVLGVDADVEKVSGVAALPARGNSQDSATIDIEDNSQNSPLTRESLSSSSSSPPVTDAYDRLDFAALMEVAQDRGILVENPYSFPSRSMPARKDALKNKLRDFDTRHAVKGGKK